MQRCRSTARHNQALWTGLPQNPNHAMYVTSYCNHITRTRVLIVVGSGQIWASLGVHAFRACTLHVLEQVTTGV